MQVVATDADEPGNANSDIRYKILSQDPPLPQNDMFDINPVSGQIRVKSVGLDAKVSYLSSCCIMLNISFAE